MAPRRRTIPGFGLTFGITLAWLGLLILLPLAALFLKAAGLGAQEWQALLSSPRVVSAFKLSFGTSALAAAANVALGLLVFFYMIILLPISLIAARVERRMRHAGFGN